MLLQWLCGIHLLSHKNKPILSWKIIVSPDVMLINFITHLLCLCWRPCGILTGNKLIRLGLLSSSDKINISSNEDCIVDLTPDYRTNFKAIVTKTLLASRFGRDNFRNRVLPSSWQCRRGWLNPIPDIQLEMTAYFGNTRGWQILPVSGMYNGMESVHCIWLDKLTPDGNEMFHRRQQWRAHRPRFFKHLLQNGYIR